MHGSSPLARGLHVHHGPRGPGWRIIPARAGFTLRVLPAGGRRRDHPRSRGVYLNCSHELLTRTGSSPLARGLRPLVTIAPISSRIIPARAGFTGRPAGRGPRRADHPRSRGVYGVGGDVSVHRVGSSPLARGLRRTLLGVGDGHRIIPARAGFTHPPGGPRSSTPDHPRSRGVYLTGGVPVGGTVGSSPLARGLLVVDGPGVDPGRIIPARAGFTLADPWNPNDEPHYQTAFTFTADLAPAPQSSDSAAVAQRSTRPPSEA